MDQPSPKRRRRRLRYVTFTLRNVYKKRPWEVTEVTEVKTEFAGEIGDPNLLYDQVSRYLY